MTLNTGIVIIYQGWKIHNAMAIMIYIAFTGKHNVTPEISLETLPLASDQVCRVKNEQNEQ